MVCIDVLTETFYALKGKPIIRGVKTQASLYETKV